MVYLKSYLLKENIIKFHLMIFYKFHFNKRTLIIFIKKLIMKDFIMQEQRYKIWLLILIIGIFIETIIFLSIIVW